VNVELPKDSDWVYYNIEALKQHYPRYNFEYHIQVKDSIIYAKSMYSKRCDVINADGIVIDTISYDTIPFVVNLRKVDTSKRYVWEKWKFNVNFSDKSRITELNYTSRPTESLKLLSRRRPKREHRIEYVLDGKNYSMVLPTTRGSSTVYNVCQYDETRFLFSAYLKIEEIKYNGPRYYVIMLDLEDLKRRRFLGLKL